MAEEQNTRQLLDKVETLETLLAIERGFRRAIVRNVLYEFVVDLTEDSFIRPDKNYFFELEVTAVIPSYSSIIDKILAERIPPEQEEYVRGHVGLAALLAAFAKGTTFVSADYQRRTFIVSNWVRFHAALTKDPRSGHIIALIFIKNINVEKKNEISLVQKAQRDPLTSLFNRDATSALIEKELSCTDYSEPNSGHVLICLDVDNFKGINDEYGHQTGDKVLSGFADILRHVFRKNDIISRMGGDEFQVFMANCTEKVAAAKAAEVLQMLRKEFTEFKVGSSIGIACAPVDGRTQNELYVCADRALYTSKDRGKNQYTLYSEIRADVRQA